MTDFKEKGMNLKKGEKGILRKSDSPKKYKQFDIMSEEMTFISLLLKYKVQAVEKAVVIRACPWGPECLMYC